MVSNIPEGKMANMWTCSICGAVYHRMRDVESHAEAGDGHVRFTAFVLEGTHPQ